ncbi:MAG: acylase [Sphingomonas bacterium]|uniref:penicillin acylase family protein n=1 Tax=Sphingomonas bacterium TaxID=1895847 RepID=UPI00261F2F45|nr:penicillin acylase family protein [Sphingomonas bacterium]MDB5695082.1 acylase [Sphingomonas bacterium]
MRLTPALLALALLGATSPPPDMDRWRAQAARVTIERDDWGIPHIRGRSDADAVFGAIYAQAEDDFPRIEANYLTALGRTAEAEGEAAIWADLRQRLWMDPVALQAEYRRSPAWLRALMEAWADGLNFYLATHPAEKPRVLTRFEPWMALSFTEGSIGGDIEKVDLAQLAAFYGTAAPQLARVPDADAEPRGSNGIAIAPKLTKNGRALLLINPHTSFFFRAELQMTSDAGLNAYGASTWGQFFIYQGWNERVGWMHTTSGADSVDFFSLDVTRRGPDMVAYRYGREQRALTASSVRLRFREADGSMGERSFRTWRSQHGPVVRKDGAKWVSAALMHKPVPALEQSWLRTRAKTYAEYVQVAARQANSSNNTVYADADGRTALLLPQFVPARDDRVDYRGTVDGSDPATAWRGPTPMAKLPRVIDPTGGWLYNANDAPWRAAGANSPRREAFPRYMDQAGANPRGDHSLALLSPARALDRQGLRTIAYDPWLPAFDRLVPQLAVEWRGDAPSSRRDMLAEPVQALERWDRRASADSIATTLAMFWADEMWPDAVRHQRPPDLTPWDWLTGGMPAGAKLAALERAVARLRRDFGRWDVPWGEVNRFQRNDAAIVQRFDDAKPSTPVPFGSARWGSLASFGARAYPGTKRWYGTSGNSFVAIVEFGPRVRAWAVTAGGQSGRPGSPHFSDQATRYAAGDLRPVYFWPDELKGHVERRYRPGE